jgi:hypothetical protein
VLTVQVDQQRPTSLPAMSFFKVVDGVNALAGIAMLYVVAMPHGRECEIVPTFAYRQRPTEIGSEKRVQA